ncbi:T9SS type A sorting domain-containing protein [Polaribacter ponticola]|uniref:T9SS type A sorting domain-containing protein n=1 Tax=Polaribacter ponticola TaxID=2978475 RepID=A0ABT5S6H1_9FLAO|nr:right-handed parallel beta-helix repeat-containing protein [Polaribacter sp. MSW5]MDD7913215.1 T9SS type A sorting domain-containing protein [Polaribacter sp. MSW5]
MLKKTLFLLFTIVIIGQMSAQKCNYTINSYKWSFDGSNIGKQGNVTIHDAESQIVIERGDSLKLKGGDVICLDASVQYKFLRFKNIIGDSVKPVIITNINGKVKIKSITASYGWKFQNSKYFKILGNGDSNHKYGFKVTTHNNSYLQMINKTTDFEIAHVEIAGDTVAQSIENASSITPKNLLGFAGIMAKSQPICRDDPNGGSTDAGEFEMQNVFIHDNYIHDVFGEGLYIGYGFSQGTIVKSYTTGEACTSENFPHFISNLFIYNNIVERVGWDGIQVKNTHRNAQIYNNVIKDYAFREIGHHDEGILVGDGSVAVIHGNWIENGTKQSNGMQINATGNTKIYNNVVLGSGYTGLYLNNRNYLNLDGIIEIYNNTIEGGSGNGITSYSPQTIDIKNNIVFGYGKKDTLNDPYPTKGIKADIGTVSFNLINKDVSEIGFKDFINKNVELNETSSAINSGTNHNFDVYDFSGNIRDTRIDLGAFEYGTDIKKDSLDITINLPTSNSVTLTSEQNVLINVSLKDKNNKVRLIEYELNNSVIGTNYIPNKLEHTIGFHHFIQGTNILKVKVTLYGGNSFYSDIITIQNNSVLSFESEHLLENRLHYYYNSNNKELVLNRLDDTEITAVEIYDLLGKKAQNWKNKQVSKHTTRLAVNNLSKGIYIIRVITDKGVLSKKILM